MGSARLVSVSTQRVDTRTSLEPTREPEFSRVADPTHLRGHHHSSKPYVPHSVKACEDDLWTMALVNKETGETKLKPFRCKSWRCKRCAPFVNRMDYLRVKKALSRCPEGSLGFTTFTFNRGAYKDRDACWDSVSSCWKKFQDRLAYHYGERGRGGKKALVRYITVVEQHKDGWPHLHSLIQCAELMEDLKRWGTRTVMKDGKATIIQRINSKVLRPMYVESGFGEIGDIQPPDKMEAMAGYLIKLAAELTGSHRKQDQTPVQAPHGFRRLRASAGFLAPRKSAGDFTGWLVPYTTEQVEEAEQAGHFNWCNPKKTNGKDSRMPRVRRFIRSKRNEAPPESEARDRDPWRRLLFTGSATQAYSDPDGG